jgi:hypothetical protein
MPIPPAYIVTQGTDVRFESPENCLVFSAAVPSELAASKDHINTKLRCLLTIAERAAYHIWWI